MRKTVTLPIILLLTHARMSLAMNVDDSEFGKLDEGIKQNTKPQNLPWDDAAEREKLLKTNLGEDTIKTTLTINEITIVDKLEAQYGQPGGQIDIIKMEIEKLKRKGRGQIKELKDEKSLLNEMGTRRDENTVLLDDVSAAYEDGFVQGLVTVEPVQLKDIRKYQVLLEREYKHQLKIVNLRGNALKATKKAIWAEIRELKNLQHPPLTENLVEHKDLGEKLYDKNIKTVSGEGGSARFKALREAFNKTYVRWGVGTVMLFVALTGFAWSVGWLDGLSGGLSSTQIADDMNRRPPPRTLLKDGCVELHAAATRAEGAAQERYLKDWNSTINAMGSVFASAYQQAHQSGIENIKGLVAESWGPSNVAPLSEPYIPARASSEYRNNVTATHIEEQKHWYLKQLFRPIQLELDFTQQHYESIHQIAFVLMRESTALPYDTHSDHFNMAYTVHYARTSLPTQCFKFIREDRATVNRFADTRAELAIQSSETQVVLNSYFAARAELSPPPPSLPAVLAAPPAV